MAHQSVIVLPDDGAAPILEAIANAKKSIRIKMFVFTASVLIEAIIAARQRGVHIRVMLNSARRSGEEDNEATRKRLLAADIKVIDSSPQFGLTHEKSMVIDDELALVHTLNWATRNLTETRDYAIVTSHRHEVDEIVACFEADWHRRPFQVGENAHLIWCPLNGRDRIARFIDHAKHTLFIQNERYQDSIIIEHLVRAARRGVKVHVMSPSPHKLDKSKRAESVGELRTLGDVDVELRKLKDLKLHGKIMLADEERALVGSINLTPGTFDSRREVAIEISDNHILRRLRRVVEHDWKHGHSLDLSDEGLRAEISNQDEVRSLGIASVEK